MAKYVKNFMNWVEEMKEECLRSPSYIRVYSMCNNGPYTVLINYKTGEITKAKCHENDKFDSSIGVAIAWARYKGYEIPRETVNISELKYGQKFKFPRMEHHPIGVFIGEHPLDKGWYLFSYKDKIIRALPKNTEVILID